MTRYDRIYAAAFPVTEPANLEDPATVTIGDLRAAVSAADTIRPGDKAREGLDTEV